ncbi:hypothetical protein E4T56_gene6157, partial [Termitomyces sp. T112]
MSAKPLLDYILNHVFLPPRLPQSDDSSMENDLAICDLVIRNAQVFSTSLSSDVLCWGPIIRMLINLESIYSVTSLDKQALKGLVSRLTNGETLVIPVRAQNACVFIRRSEASTIYELFEVDPPNNQIMAPKGRLVRWFPGPALEINDTALTPAFQSELASFLADMDVVDAGSAASTRKAGSKVFEIRDTADPHYITQLLTSILHGCPGSQPAGIERIEKRVRNEIMWRNTYTPWRRSPLWLIIRIAIQTTLQRASSSGRAEYKAFIIFLLTDFVLSGDECREISTELLTCIQNKIVRRLRKLSDAAPDALLSRATEAIRKVRDIMEKRWKDIQSQQALSPPWAPESLDIAKDTTITLLSSKEYLYSRIHQPPTSPTTAIFDAPKIHRLNIDDLLHPHAISAALSKNPFIALGDLEQLAIDQGLLEAWLDENRSNLLACSALGKCIIYYALSARTEYKDNPEHQSVMLLTVFLLWSALDRLAIIQHPLLADYSPEIPKNILDPILLRKSESIESLIRFRSYVCKRYSRAHLGSIFSDKLSKSSFPIRHYLASDSLKQLKQKIEEESRIQRETKRREFVRLQAEYDKLNSEARTVNHEHGVNGSRKKCRKCKLTKKASKLEIRVHEWPLPEDKLSAQATVFELRCPKAFQAWRSTTYTILYEFCRPGLSITGKHPDAEINLADYLGLKAYCREQTRITYASHTKPFIKSHYSTQKIQNVDSGLASILVSNGLRYRLFDTVLERWAEDSFADCAVAEYCMFKLPSTSSYSTLQYAMQVTTHSSNQPLADQAAVPPELAVHEYTSFGTLRSGPMLQWLNILRELRARILSFDRLEVHMLLTQAAMQTGDIKGEELQWHDILKKPDFGVILLNEIDDVLLAVESNWHHIITLQTIIILVSRLLASSREQRVVSRACSTLRTVRKIAFAWVRSLVRDLERSDSEASLNLLQQRVCLAAATCQGTYDVDICHFSHLINSDGDVDIYIQCAIYVQANAPAVNPPVELDIFLTRNRRMSQKLAPAIWDRIQASRTGIDDSILAVWSDYRPGSDWKQLPAPNKHWMTSTILDSTSTDIQSRVHYNLLDGSLLIDGQPLGRLPPSIIHHSTYIRLLGNRILDIVPSTLPDMHFATRNTIAAPNLFLHFQLPGPDGNLIVQAKLGRDLFELVPHTAFGCKKRQDFPTSFITEYAHWLHLSPASSSSRCITFHPLESIWQPSEKNWSLIFNSETCTGTMSEGGGSRIVDVRSETFRMVSKRLEPLEVSDRIHVILLAKHTLSVRLPRYKMVFFLNNDKDLECSTIRDMVVDLDQSVGTFYGLDNQLVLRNKFPCRTRIAAPASRCIVIPFGQVSFKSHHHHSRVTVSLGDETQTYVTYQVDSTLGRLVGTTLLSDIYRIYLHACTSFPLPDDLTGRTGTEEALRELESARSFSFQDLSAEEAALLHDIADLTPGVEWYPKHLRSMQTIHWKNFNSLAQHWAFASRVEDILGFHRQMSSIGIGTPRDGLDSLADSHLLARLDSRTSGLYAAGRKAPLPHYDMVYPIVSHSISLRKTQSEEILTLTTNVSNLSFDASAHLDTVSDLWQRLQRIRVITNMTHAIDSYHKFISPCLTDLFLPLYEMCRQDQPCDGLSSKMAFALSSMAYTSSHDESIIRLIPTFLSFARSSEFRSISPPSPIEYDLDSGLSPHRGALLKLLENSKLSPPSDQPSRQRGETDRHYNARRASYWESLTRQQIERVIDFLIQQWPCRKPSLPPHLDFDLLDLTASALKNEVSQVFLRWFNNMNFRTFIEKVQTVMNQVHRSSGTPIPLTLDSYYVPPFPNVTVECLRFFPTTLEDLCLRYEPHTPLIPTPKAPSMGVSIGTDTSPIQFRDSESLKLASLVEQFRDGPQVLHHIYGDALKNSLNSYVDCGTEVSGSHPHNGSPLISLLHLENEYELRRREFNIIYNSLQVALSPRGSLETVEGHASQWPCLKTRSLLCLLLKDGRGDPLPTSWQAAVVVLAQALIRLQRSRRMLLYKLSSREEDLLKEFNNADCEVNGSFSHLEWLLIQVGTSLAVLYLNSFVPKIDGNFKVRPVQSSVAQEMISPRSGENSLTQLNMGEGKSAVIVPLISSALSDGQRLVRVVVLKPLVNQMFDLLVQRLSRLTNHRVFYLPFSRDFKIDLTHLKQLQSLYETCVREKGLLLIQPEHILSFRLMGVDLAAGVHSEAAGSLLASHRWLLSKARDVLDESDEILRATYQLVYTSGLQEPLDNHQDRWTIIQEVLGYIHSHAEKLRSMYPVGLEIHYPEKFGCPIIRILDIEAGEVLIDTVVSEVLGSHRFKLLPLHIRPAASDFIRCHRGSIAPLNALRNFLHDNNAWKHLLLYRGLFGHGLLRFVLQEKRWRVDYGLDLSRTLLAVPYRAKDLPSLKADFGHPDVALLLTCLSYYYGGLTEEQLDQCFELLFKLDDPSLEYNQWVSSQEEIFPSFRNIESVNLDDEYQRKVVLGPLFRKNKAVIDFFLSNVVFPRCAKQFPKKLSTSSWDLAETKAQVTTGFSGTNDNRYLLPTSIRQNDYDSTAPGDHDPFGQLATNAKVLNILLQSENGTYYCIQDENGHSPTGSDFLELLVKQTPPVRVLLDVGAQMLDMQNTELVSRWLSLVPDLHAVVFFNVHDELVVMSQDRQIEKFVTSQYNEKLDLCAVYLDDSHTRGTDLKLPNDFRAVVTLGPKLTKDRLVQGCMRMRQLGRGQSVMFFAPKEVDQSIRSCKLYPLEPSAQVSTADILRWTMWQTCENIRRYIPHWVQQGVEYKRRNDAWVLHERDPSAPGALQKLRSSWEEPDARTLNEMYGLQSDPLVTSFHPAFELPNLKERLDQLGVSVLSDVGADEEQERQVFKEAEKERQRELPPKVEPASPQLHKALKSLIQSGNFNPDPSPPFILLFSPLRSKHEWSNALFSTEDFATTVKGGASVGDFLRPVNWILSAPAHRVLIVLSPFEVNQLLPLIWKSKHVHLHIYTPRVNQNMKTTEDLRFFTVPPLPTSSDLLAFVPDLMLQLNLFAGQLYLKDFETYRRLCRLLGLVGAEFEAR